MDQPTRNEVIADFFRRCEVVNKAEEADLLDVDEAQRMRDRYRQEADEKLRVLVPTS